MWLPYAPNSSWLPYDCITSFRSHKPAHRETTSRHCSPASHTYGLLWLDVSKQKSFILRPGLGEPHDCRRSATQLWVRVKLKRFLWSLVAVRLLYIQPREFPKFILGDFNWTMVNMNYHQSQQKYIHNPSPRQSRKRHNKRKRVSLFLFLCVCVCFPPARRSCCNFWAPPLRCVVNFSFFSLYKSRAHSCLGSDPAAVFGQQLFSLLLICQDFLLTISCFSLNGQRNFF